MVLAMMITPKQIKAARVLLDWKQIDLSKATGLSKTAIANIESGYVLPRQRSLTVIQQALETSGIEFMDMQGVRIKSEIFDVDNNYGPTAHIHYFQDIIETIAKSDEEVLQSFIDDQFIMRNFRKEFFRYYQEMIRLGGKEKILTCEGDEVRYGPPEIAEYRWVSRDSFDPIGYTVYGNKVALFLYTKDWHHIVIENERIVETYRRQFYRNWEKANPISLPKAKFLEDLGKSEKK